jgi:starch phosphorylase
MVSDYASRAYVPAMTAFAAMRADDCARAKAALDWRARVLAAWPGVKVASVLDDAPREAKVGTVFHVRAAVLLGKLAPAEVRVEAVVGRIGQNQELVQTRKFPLEFVEMEGERSLFVGAVPCDDPGHLGYTVRITPHNPDIDVESELGIAAWQAP